MTDFPTLSYTSTSKIPTLSYLPEALKRHPFRAEPSPLGGPITVHNHSKPIAL